MKRFMVGCLSMLFLFSHLSYALDIVPLKSNSVPARMAKKTQTQSVDINHADLTQLTSLKGMGPVKANAIIAYRTKNGPFKSVGDLTSIRGIKAKTLARLQAKNPGRIVVNNA